MSEPRVKIVSTDGTIMGTKVLIDGEPLDGVSAIEWRIGAGKHYATCVLTVDRVVVDVTTFADFDELTVVTPE